MEQRSNRGYYRTNSDLSTDIIRADQWSYNILQSCNDQDETDQHESFHSERGQHESFHSERGQHESFHSERGQHESFHSERGQHESFHSERAGLRLAQSISGEQYNSHQNGSAIVQNTVPNTDNIENTYHDQAYSSQQRPAQAEISQPSLALSRSGLLSYSHQSTSFDSGFAENPQEASDHPVARQPLTVQTSQESRSGTAAQNQVISESLSSLADVETVSWNSKTDELIDSLLRPRPVYRRRVPPAVPPRDVYRAPQMVLPAAHTVTNIGLCSSSDSYKSGSRTETYTLEQDDGRSTSQSNRTSSRGTSRYDADDESTARTTKTAEIIYTKKGYLDRYRDCVSYESDFESDAEENERQLQTLSPADWQSLSSFSYEGDTQMGLADCLVARGEVLSEADRDALKLDLSWLDKEKPAPQRRLTRPATVTIRRGHPTATLTPDPTSATAPKGEGRIRRFFRRIRKLFSCCHSGNAEE